jgi:antitoxin VapB
MWRLDRLRSKTRREWCESGHVDRATYIQYIPIMTDIVKTSAFKSGNSVAVRLPKAFGVKAGDELELERGLYKIELRPVTDPDAERAKVLELVRRLRELGPVKTPRPRDPIEFPDRPGLY